MPISFDSRVIVAADVLVSQLDGECVLLNAARKSSFRLDEVGTSFWELLTSSPSIQGAYEMLLARYDIDAETLRMHLTEFVDGLRTRGVIELPNS